MKGPGEAEWGDVTSRGSFATFNKNGCNFRIWSMATNYVGLADYRIRAVDSSTSETSDWVELGPIKATINIKGTPIYGANCNGNAFDGLLHTMVDATGDSGNDKYVGYLFDKPKLIRAVRYLPRLDHMKLPARYRSSIFQVASDETFSDAVTVHTVPSNFSAITGATEVVFDEPVSATAIRHYKATGGFESSAEVEFIPDDMPLASEISIVYSDVTNFHPIVSWTMPASFMCSTCRLERAINADGPWVAQSPWLDPSTDSLCVTNTDLYVGVSYYYRISGYTSHPDYSGQCSTSDSVTYTRMRRIDRSWGDESSLYDGISVMVGTNGAALNVVGGRTAAHAFDGNASTFPDLTKEWCRHGPLGLDFGEPAWVGAFGYICRNDNICYSRIRYSALFSASGDDLELGDMVKRSANVSQYSQDDTFYSQSATSVPADGAKQWFLYGTTHSGSDYFFGNVAELAFFGWTAADKAAAPVVLAPDEIAFTRGDTGPVVSWSAGNRAQQYTLRRRERGTSEWTDVATLGGSVLTYTDAGLAAGFWEYCVVADGGELGTATSEAFSYAWYTAGSGTGLSGVVMWPYCSTNMIPWQMTSYAPRGPEAVNLVLGAGEEVASGVSAHARIAWEGKLIVPFDGSYTFTLETDAGGAVAVDDVFAGNIWTGGSKTSTGTLTLTAGEHRIRVDYRLSEDSAPTKKCILRWGGVVQDEVIPASQLLPADTAPSPQLDGWTCLTYAMNRVGQFVKTSSGTYKVTAAAQNMGDPDSFNAAFMWKKMTGSFAVEAMVKEGNAYGFGGIMIQGGDGHFVAPYFYVNGALSYYGVKKYVPGDDTWSQEVPWTQFGNSSNYDCYLRVEKRGREVVCLWKDLKSDEWTTIYTCTVPSGTFGREVAVGPTVNGFSGTNPAQFIFSSIKLDTINEPTMVIFK